MPFDVEEISRDLVLEAKTAFAEGYKRGVSDGSDGQAMSYIRALEAEIRRLRRQLECASCDNYDD